MVRKYKKDFTRRFSLITVQYWYEGERFGLEKLTQGSMYFDPLFISNENDGISVYYDINNPKTYVRPLFDFFRNKNTFFKRLSNKYLNDVLEVQKIINNLSIDNLDLVYKTVVNDIWPMITASVVLGRKKDIKGLEDIAEMSIKLRQKTDKFEYQLSEKIPQVIAEAFPSYKDYAEYLTIEEVLSKNFPPVGELEKRMKIYIYFDRKLLINKTVKELEDENDLRIEIPKLARNRRKRLSGFPASLGKASGRIKILMSSKDNIKMEIGDILVAPMTTPDYLPALNKAAAFITDEGGITSHAAIVARELKKPCIVGTKIATQIFKDGDLVDVDANNGIVTIID